MDDKEYSVKVAVEKLDKEIAKLDRNIADINNAIATLGETKASLRVSLAKKEEMKRKLELQRYEYISNTGSLNKKNGKVSIRDKRIDRVTEKLEQTKIEAANLNTKNKNLFIKVPAKLKSKKLQRLKKKQCRLEKRQTKITNLKVSLAVLKMKYISSKEGKREGLKDARRLNLLNIRENQDIRDELKREDMNKFKKAGIYTKTGLSILNGYAKYGLINTRCLVLQTKDIIVDGVTYIPKEIVNKIKDARASDTRTR